MEYWSVQWGTGVSEKEREGGLSLEVFEEASWRGDCVLACDCHRSLSPREKERRKKC